MMCSWFQRQWKADQRRKVTDLTSFTALGHALQIRELYLTDNHMGRTSTLTHPGSPSLGKAVSRNEELETKASASFQRRGKGRHHGHDSVSTEKLSRKLLLLRV